MKAICLPLLLCVSLNHAVFAQTPDKAIWLAHYNFSHVTDTAKAAKVYTEKFILLLGKNASVYRSLDKQLAEEKMADEVATQVKNAANSGGVELTLHGNGNTTSDEYYQYANDKKLYTEKRIINYYVSEEPMPAINWKISRDTATFAGQHCQKATAHFKGRDYVAWFCPSLPFQNGPWKLNGLPGLIVEGYDTKKEVVFKFDGFEDRGQSADLIQVDPTDIKTTPEELNRLVEARAKDPSGFSKAMRGSGGSRQRRITDSPLNSISPANIKSINIISGGPKIVMNNPIELPEKN